jgi:hypothetical protein
MCTSTICIVLNLANTSRGVIAPARFDKARTPRMVVSGSMQDDVQHGLQLAIREAQLRFREASPAKSVKAYPSAVR